MFVVCQFPLVQHDVVVAVTSRLHQLLLQLAAPVQLWRVSEEMLETMHFNHNILKHFRFLTVSLSIPSQVGNAHVTTQVLYGKLLDAWYAQTFDFVIQLFLSLRYCRTPFLLLRLTNSQKHIHALVCCSILGQVGNIGHYFLPG